MKFPMFKVAIDEESALQNLRSVFESGYVNEGIQVTEFQEGLKKHLGVNSLVVMNSCTSALTVAYKLAGVGPGTEVISSPMTCIATNTPIINLGGKIVWCDINPLTGNIDPTKIEDLITPNTKAIVYVDWAGNPAELDTIWEIGRRHEVKVIQDAAHAYGATWKGKSVSNFADYTCFSFQAIKHLSSADGGALVCNDSVDLKLARKLKWFGYDRESTKDERGEWKGQRWDADIETGEVGFKFNMNNVVAAIGLSSLKSVDSILYKHRRNASIFNEIFDHSKLIKPLSFSPHATSSYWAYTLLIDVETKMQRDAIIMDLNNIGIGAGLIHLPNDGYSAFKDFATDLPGLRDFEKNQLSLPCGWWLSEDDIRYIAHETLRLVAAKLHD
jgi:perosamine synthetase